MMEAWGGGSLLDQRVSEVQDIDLTKRMNVNEEPNNTVT